MKRIAPMVVALLTTLVLVLIATPAPAQAATAAQRYGTAAEKATNAARAKHDRVKLKGNKCLRKYARIQATKMARKGDIWHQDLNVIARKCKMSWVGENVAMGFPTGKAAVNKGWMKSKGHRRNILRKQFRLGVVVARKDSDGHWYAAQVFGRR
ncbi:CAP domain-containing protein [Nocardioides jishulii]|uniref:SCP domain-containing protein n=1 Tax=Nocardioides jishulii TaxID=2575440 RepID=A0A4U2YL51_9ACTN|nr:CAP domain-containing protein [Nocardioides jishulii]QCX26821.1 hypothetical protein FCL41_04140 [Nocardioides jishulii]TKI61305.1 hypothetical protein FC770_10775 [Nocardioides jishulii]